MLKSSKNRRPDFCFFDFFVKTFFSTRFNKKKQKSMIFFNFTDFQISRGTILAGFIRPAVDLSAVDLFAVDIKVVSWKMVLFFCLNLQCSPIDMISQKFNVPVSIFLCDKIIYILGIRAQNGRKIVFHPTESDKIRSLIRFQCNNAFVDLLVSFDYKWKN